MDTAIDTAHAADDTADVAPASGQPGLGELRDAAARRLRGRLPRLHGGAALRRDALAGLNSAISNVPDGMANGVLVGVNPVHGLYATMVGPVAGGLVASSPLMLITTTAAASLSTGQALGAATGAARTNALVVLVLLAGAFQVVLGLLGAGRLTRFVSYSVMTGFLTGVAALLVLNQLHVVTGYEATGSNRVSQAIDLLAHLGQIHLPSLAVAALTLVLAVYLPRTRLGGFGRLLAIAIPSALVALLRLRDVETVRDVGTIPRGIPTPSLPALSDITADVVTGALAVAAIILVQGAGVSQSVPRPDGGRPNASRDFIAQGAANLASGLFRGLPVGGSMSATALNLMYGARTRWAAIFAGVWMAAIVLIAPGVVSYTAMPALGALLILAGVKSIKLGEVRSIMRTGWPSGLAGATTFLATLFLPIQAAVGIGVTLSALLYVNEASTDVSVVEQVERADGSVEERPAPGRLSSRRVTVLDVYGHLFYAGARTFERLLPTPTGADQPVVVLRLRGHARLGATLIDVLARYADALHAAHGRLYVAGLSATAYDQVVRTGKLHLTEAVRAYEATPVVGESTHRALGDAERWLVTVRRDGDDAHDGDPPNGGSPNGGSPDGS